MHEHWLNKKKRSSSMSNQRIDHVYDVGRNAGARGGKLVGAGAGGFLMFYAEDTRRRARGDARGGAGRAAVRHRPRRQHHARARVTRRCSASSWPAGSAPACGRWPRRSPRPCCRSPGGRSPTGSSTGWPAPGVDSVVYCVGYLGEQVRDHVGDGSAWGLQVAYVDEGRELRGTGGALRLALDQGVLADRFLVLYGDSWLQVDPAAAYAATGRSGLTGADDGLRERRPFDASNVVYADGRVVRYEKGAGPAARGDALDRLRALGPGPRDVVDRRIPAGQTHDLAQLFTALAAEGLLAGLEVPDRFYEIGSPDGLAEVAALLEQQDP